MLYRPFCSSATVFRLSNVLSTTPTPTRLISRNLNTIVGCVGSERVRRGQYCKETSGPLINWSLIKEKDPILVSRGTVNRDFVISSKMSENNGNGTQHDRNKCVFCRIVDGKESNEVFYQDEEFVVFQDIKPAAKYHFLVVTREHIKDSKSLVPSQIDLVDRLTKIGLQVVAEQVTKDAPDTDPEQVQKLMGFHWPPFHSIAHLHLHVIAPSDQMGFIARTIFRPNSFWFVTPEYVRERLEKMAATESSKSNPQ
ncbi:unnamed protein product [Orchesella dallaii]|uniref:Adenosine 5'-monophosphoramidase HINT3 n=1 Tax=Orchesella dallaii TaxID=48710 RepID=A0ABP1PKD4_9HEXA